MLLQLNIDLTIKIIGYGGSVNLDLSKCLLLPATSQDTTCFKSGEKCIKSHKLTTRFDQSKFTT